MKKEKTNIDFFWAINYWHNRKTLEKIIENYELEKKNEPIIHKIEITDIIPNHEVYLDKSSIIYDYNDNSKFYAQNLISWSLSFKENPVRVFTHFSNLNSLMYFYKWTKDFKKDRNIYYKDIIKEYFNKINAHQDKIHELKEDNEKDNENISLISDCLKKINDYEQKIQETQNDYEKFKKQLQNSDDYLDYIENKFFYNQFINECDSIFNKYSRKNFDLKSNLNSNELIDNKKIDELLISFIKTKYQTDITIEKIKEKYLEILKNFENNFKESKKVNFEFIDLISAIKQNEDVQRDIEFYENNESNTNIKDISDKINEMGNAPNNYYSASYFNNYESKDICFDPFLKCKALVLFLNDQIFEFDNIIDIGKIIISNYFAPNLVLNMNITPRMFNDLKPDFINEIIHDGKISKFEFVQTNQKFPNVTNNDFFKEDNIYFESTYSWDIIKNINNQICYSNSKNHKMFNLIFNQIYKERDCQGYKNDSYEITLIDLIRNATFQSNGGHRPYYINKNIDIIQIETKKNPFLSTLEYSFDIINPKIENNEKVIFEIIWHQDKKIIDIEKIEEINQNNELINI